MPLSVDNVVQRSSGTFSGTSGNATLPASTTSGNTVILILGQSAGLVTPAGFTVLNSNSIVTPKLGIYSKVVGVESSWAIAPSSTSVVTWVTYEVAGLDVANVLDVKPTSISIGTAATLSTGAIPTSSSYDAMVIGVHIARDTTSTTPSTWSGHTGGLVEIMAQGGADATTSLGMSVSETYSLSIGQFLSTATKTAPVGQASTASLVVLAANNSKRAAEIVACTGFEYGTEAGIATGANPNFNTVAGTPVVVSTSPRNGTYCLELSASAAIENVAWTAAGNLFGGTTQQCCRFSVYFPSSLPAGDVVLCSSEPATAGQFTIIRFKNATSKLSIQVGSGTEVVSDATVSTNTWISVDYRIDARTTTHKADWKVRYSDASSWVDQTQATMAGATVPSAGFTLRLGWVANTTATVRYDDVVVSNTGGHFPLGDFAITLLKPDPAGTLTISGTSTNFQTFTANGTLVAWDATVAKNAIDEVPPTLGASADGFAQVGIAASDYVEIPMETLNAAVVGGAIRGVRAIICGWAASALAATFGFRFHDGVSELAPTGAINPTFDNTSTPGWYAHMIRGITSRQDWTQAKLDALTVRAGFSTDTSPAVGVHAVYCEVALKMCDLVRVGSAEEGTFTVDFRIDTDSSAVIAIIVTSAPGDRGCTFTWAILGVDQTPIYVAGGNSHTEYIGATDIATVTGYTLTPDP